MAELRNAIFDASGQANDRRSLRPWPDDPEPTGDAKNDEFDGTQNRPQPHRHFACFVDSPIDKRANADDENRHRQPAGKAPGDVEQPLLATQGGELGKTDSGDCLHLASNLRSHWSYDVP